MDEYSAWKKFIGTGSVNDYLAYVNIKNQNLKSSGESEYANKNGWSDNSREKFI